MQPNKKACLLTLLIGLGLALATSASVKVGDALPELASYKLEGKMPELSKGTVVLIDFWASWCGPCVKSFPIMDELQKKYGPQGLVIIAVSVDDNKSDMENFLKTHPVSFSVVRDVGHKLVEKTGISAMPSSFLMDKNGRIAFVHSGFHGSTTKKQYESEIESLLKPDQK